MAIDVTDATFQTEVIDKSADVPVVVDLWAPWCGPCRTLTPILEKVVGETNGQVALVKVNVDESPGISARYGVRSIPTMLLFDRGRLVDQQVGALPHHAVTAWLDRHAGGGAPG